MMNVFSGTAAYLEKRPNVIWTVILIYAVLIYLVSSMSNPPEPEFKTRLEAEAITTIGHFFEYALFGILLFSGYRSLGGAASKKAMLLAIAAATLYGALDEIHQFFVPNRDCSIVDLTADFLGAAVGSIIREKTSN